MTVFFWHRKNKQYAYNTATDVKSALRYGLADPRRKKPIRVVKIKDDEFRTNTPYDLHLGELGYSKKPRSAFILFRGRRYEFPSL